MAPLFAMGPLRGSTLLAQTDEKNQLFRLESRQYLGLRATRGRVVLGLQDSRTYALVVGCNDKDSNLVLLQSFGAGACP